jgi:hypothetical protein
MIRSIRKFFVTGKTDDLHTIVDEKTASKDKIK